MFFDHTCFYFLSQWEVGLLDLIPQNTAFMMITINTTAAMDIQNPMLNPIHSHVPKRFIQSIFQFIFSTS